MGKVEGCGGLLLMLHKEIDLEMTIIQNSNLVCVRISIIIIDFSKINYYKKDLK